MVKRVFIAIIIGLIFAATSLFVKGSYYSDISSECPLNAECASKPSAITKGWPFIATEVFNDFRDTTDDFQTSSSFEVRPFRSGEQPDSQFKKYADINRINYPLGFLINWLLYGAVALGLTYLIKR